jgi:hypothetical protein
VVRIRVRREVEQRRRELVEFGGVDLHMQVIQSQKGLTRWGLFFVSITAEHQHMT